MFVPPFDRIQGIIAANVGAITDGGRNLASHGASACAGSDSTTQELSLGQCDKFIDAGKVSYIKPGCVLDTSVVSIKTAETQVKVKNNTCVENVKLTCLDGSATAYVYQESGCTGSYTSAPAENTTCETGNVLTLTKFDTSDSSCSGKGEELTLVTGQCVHEEPGEQPFTFKCDKSKVTHTSYGSAASSGEQSGGSFALIVSVAMAWCSAYLAK